jgi:hypothetical protein
MNLDLFDRFSKNAPVSNSWKFLQWKPSCSMRTDRRTERQTDMTKLIVAFCNFPNAPKKTFSFLVMGSVHQLASCPNCYFLLSYKSGKTVGFQILINLANINVEARVGMSCDYSTWTLRRDIPVVLVKITQLNSRHLKVKTIIRYIYINNKI